MGMLEFKPVSIEDKTKIEKYLNIKPYRGSDGSFANLFLWQHLYHTEFCIEEGFLFVKGGIGGQLGFMCPFGDGDLARALEKIRFYSERFPQKPFLDGVTVEQKELIEKTVPGVFTFRENRDDADYLYLSEDLASLSGKKYHAKRTFVSKFMDEYYGRFEYLPLVLQRIDEVREFEKKWFDDYLQEESNEDLEEELLAINLMLKNYESLGARGGILKVDGKVAAYTMGTPGAFDTFIVQFEKADYNIPGAYQTINKLFSSDCLDYKYLNREDDMGHANLRKAKLSYHPAIILVKYTAVWNEIN